MSSGRRFLRKAEKIITYPPSRAIGKAVSTGGSIFERSVGWFIYINMAKIACNPFAEKTPEFLSKRRHMIEAYRKKLLDPEAKPTLLPIENVLGQLKHADREFLAALESELITFALNRARKVDEFIDFDSYALEVTVGLIHRIGTKEAADGIAEVIEIIGPKKAMSHIIAPLEEIGYIDNLPTLVRMLNARRYYPRKCALRAIHAIASRCTSKDDLDRSKTIVDEAFDGLTSEFGEGRRFSKLREQIELRRKKHAETIETNPFRTTASNGLTPDSVVTPG